MSIDHAPNLDPLEQTSIFSSFLPSETNPSPKQNLGIYVHVPWCLQKCHYCDFYSIGLNGLQTGSRNNDFTGSPKVSESPRPTMESLANYLHHIEYELEMRLTDQSFFRNFSHVNTIYFGGGTPSLLESEEIARLIEKFKTEFILTEDCEITIEGNPENMSPAYLSALHDVGVNRVNVGIQSFQSKTLKLMNRYFSPDRYARVLEYLKSGPIANFGIDLIYGFPKQTQAIFYKDLLKVFSAQPAHLSLYNLTVESGTVYDHAVRTKTLSPPNDELQNQIWEDLPSIIQKHSMLQQYEVSNFALPGQICRHNFRYWLYEPYLALGPGAHGFDGYHRYSNSKNLQHWLKMSRAERYSVHEPLWELPMMIMRVSLPLPLYLWEHILLKKYNLATEKLEQAMICLENWVHQDFAEFQDKNQQRYFQWKQAGLSFLNDRVLEMHQALMGNTKKKNSFKLS